MSQGWDGPTEERARCTAPVRWCKGWLQQQWVVDTVTAGSGSIGLVIDTRVEWRDVPRIDHSLPDEGAIGNEQARTEEER